jgi:glutathione S-transferase
MASADGLSLYHFDSCPFCARVRGAMVHMSVDIELRDISREKQHYDELISATGRQSVPCLRIEEGSGVDWLFESADIIQYLETRFGAAAR